MRSLFASRDVPLGAVGYAFRKEFPGYGWFDGTVIEIRPGAAGDKDRRCLYSDGDSEDLSLADLRALAARALDKKLESKATDKHRKLNTAPSKRAHGLERSQGRDEDFGSDFNKEIKKLKTANLKSEVEGCVKLRATAPKPAIQEDATVSYSLHPIVDKEGSKYQQARSSLDDERNHNKVAPPASSQHVADDASCEEDDGDESEENDAWLEKVASLLGASKVPNERSIEVSSSSSNSGRAAPVPFASHSRCSSLSVHSDRGSSNAYSGGVRPGLSPIEHATKARSSSNVSSISPVALCPLASMTPGKRHGVKVFLMNDPRRNVGEVIMENHGYAEAVINGKLEKARVSKFIVAPKGYNIGDSVQSSLPLPVADMIGKVGNKRCVNQSERDGKINGAASAKKKANKDPSACETMSTPIKGCVKKMPSDVESPTQEVTLSVDSLFYWCCERCTMVNRYSERNCCACFNKKSGASFSSALLAIAEAAIETKVDSAADALNRVPLYHRPSIPEIVLLTLISAGSAEGHSIPRGKCPPPPSSLDSYFYWCCGSCTMQNSYKRSKCVACSSRKGPGSVSSALLQIAAEAATNARSTKEALDFVPPKHRQAIPKALLSTLVTCVASVGRGNEKRRCLRPKAPGMDRCIYHCSILQRTSSSVSQEKGSDGEYLDRGDSDGQSMDHPVIPTSFGKGSLLSVSSPEEQGLVTILDTMPSFLETKVDRWIGNESQWNIQSIEDALICEPSCPFPLGLRVRRFFPRYGFHDARITRVCRRWIRNSEKGREQPMIVYRVVYNDGDAEDFLHDEISSLSQAFNKRYVESTSLPDVQIPPGTLYETRTGIVKVLKNTTPPDAANRDEGGKILAMSCKLGDPWTRVDLDLTEFQRSVVRKLIRDEFVVLGPAGSSSCVEEEEIPVYESRLSLYQDGTISTKPVPSSTALAAQNRLSKDQSLPLPVLEWPRDGRRRDQLANVPKDYSDILSICPGLFLRRHQHYQARPKDTVGLGSSDSGVCSTSPLDDQSFVRSGLSRVDGWDPANAFDHTLWDPYLSITCDICKEDKDDHQILICDGCHLGYHMYCVRPVIVNVPTGDWHCTRCTGGRDGTQPFADYTTELHNEFVTVASFLGLSYGKSEEFLQAHKEELVLFSPSTHHSSREAVIGNFRTKATVKVGSLFFTRKPNNPDTKNDWVIPLPLMNADLYGGSLVSMVAAMKYCGMQTYSEELVYPDDGGATEDMNDASLDTERVEPLSKRHVDIFHEFKENLKRGAYPPIRIVHDQKVGFSVEALADMPRHTLIGEYVGDVTTVHRSGETSSDSLMMLLDTGNSKTSLLIDPTRTGNIARFLSGVNNRCFVSKRKANVRTRRFAVDGKCRVALFTARKVKAGEKLHYDYNAGIKGKSVEEWAKTGFYDTSNFF